MVDRKIIQERRDLFVKCVGLFGLATSLSIRATQTGAADKPAMATPVAFINQAFRMRDLALETGDQGYGAVIVKDGRIVGQAPSRVVVNHDPTAHAEMEAIRDAARKLGTRDLSGCVLYSSSRACPMCEAAGYWAGLEGMRFGHAVSDAGRPQLQRC